MSSAETAPTRDESMTPTSIATEHLTQLRANIEAWRSGELDYLAFSDLQQATWAQIRSCGPEIEKAVRLALLEVRPIALVKWMRAGAPRTVDAQPRFATLFRGRVFHIALERSLAGALILHVAPTTEATSRQASSRSSISSPSSSSTAAMRP